MKKTKNYLAIDLGASSGKAILGKYDGQKIEVETILKFPNGGVKLNGHLYWDIISLWQGVKKAINLAYEVSRDQLVGLAIDSWGVDYGLIAKDGSLLSLPYHYRDSRTNNLMEEIFDKESRKEIYRETGTQFLQLNTLVQLYADLKYRPWVFKGAASLLFIPDLLNYFLTKKAFNELTIASTSQFLSPYTREWSNWIFKRFNLPVNIVNALIEPGQILGPLAKDVREELGLTGEIKVFSAASHDTASAIAAIPFEEENSIYISSGTWSLLGVELDEPLINDISLEEGFTNELGINNKITFLKNLCGLWLIQECKRIWKMEGKDLSYGEISSLARQEKKAKFILEPDNVMFLNPDNMLEAIKSYCQSTAQYFPQTIGEFARGIYESLALNYKRNIEKLEVITDRSFQTIHIVGGGSKEKLLSQLTANYTGKRVVVGPVEASAMGNILAQLMASGEIRDINEGRRLVQESITLDEFYPRKESFTNEKD